MTAKNIIETLETLAFTLARFSVTDWQRVDRLRLKVALALDLRGRPDYLPFQKMWRRCFGDEQPDLTGLCREAALLLRDYDDWLVRIERIKAGQYGQQ